MDIPVYIETPTVPGSIELGEALRDQGFRLGESCSVLNSELLLCVLFTSSCFYKVVGYPPRCE